MLDKQFNISIKERIEKIDLLITYIEKTTFKLLI